MNDTRRTGTALEAISPESAVVISQDAMRSPSVFLSNLHYFFAQTDGSYAWPNSAEGDLLRQAKREIEELQGKLAALQECTARL